MLGVSNSRELTEILEDAKNLLLDSVSFNNFGLTKSVIKNTSAP